MKPVFEVKVEFKKRYMKPSTIKKVTQKKQLYFDHVADLIVKMAMVGQVNVAQDAVEYFSKFDLTPQALHRVSKVMAYLALREIRNLQEYDPEEKMYISKPGDYDVDMKRMTVKWGRQ